MDFDIDALTKQNAKQEKEMAAMMKQYGMGGGAGGKFDEEAELRKIMKEAGIEGPMVDDSADALLKQFGLNEDVDIDKMTDEELLKDLVKDMPKESPRTKAKNMKENYESLQAKTKELYGQGKKQEAVDMMRQFKAAKAEYDTYIAEHPEATGEVKAQAKVIPVQQKEEAKKPASNKVAAEPKKVPAASKASQMSIEEIYNTYHNPEEIKSMMLIDKEVKRCEELMTQVQDEDLKYALEERIDILKMNKESIESDAQNGFMSPEQYMESIEEQIKAETENFKRATKDGLDEDNKNLIVGRIKTLKEEIKDMKAGMAQQEQEEEQAKDELMSVDETKPSINAADKSVVSEEAPLIRKEKSMGGTNAYDEGIYDSIVQRKQKYIDAVMYCKDVLKDKGMTLKMMDQAEKLNQVATDYKCTSKFEKANLVPALSGEILFGMSQDEKTERFNSIYQEVDSQMKDISGRAKKCFEGSKQVKKPEEKKNLEAIASNLINQARPLKEQLLKLKECSQNPWAPLPITEVISSTKTVPKVCDFLDSEEMQFEVPDLEPLKGVKGLKQIGIKINDGNGAHLYEHVISTATEEISHVFTIPEAARKELKKMKFQFKLKENACFGMSTKDIMKTDFGLVHFGSANEITKSLKHGNVKFDVILRIKQALNGKEMHTVETSRTVIKGFHEPFNEFAARQEESRGQNPMIRVGKTVQKQEQEYSRQQAEDAEARKKKPVAPANPAQTQKPVPAQAQKPKPAAAASGGALTVPAGISQEDIQNPENQSMLRSVSYCTERIPQLQKEMQDGLAKGIRPDPKKRELIKLCSQTQGMIQQGCAQQAITPAEYCDILNEIMQKDIALVKYYSQIKEQPGIAEKLNICKFRYATIKKELAAIKAEMG